jgi:hypothetical protein
MHPFSPLSSVPSKPPPTPVAPEDGFEPTGHTPAAELSAHLRIWARSGLYDRSGLVAVAADFEELPPPVRFRLVDMALGEAHARLANAPRPTEAERLVAVLRSLPDVASSFFGAQTQHDAFDRCAAQARAAGIEPRGLVVLTLHGLSLATTGAGVNLHFAARPGQDPTQVGVDVVEALQAAGLPVYWSGEAHDVVHVRVRWLLPPGALADELAPVATEDGPTGHGPEPGA